MRAQIAFLGSNIGHIVKLERMYPSNYVYLVISKEVYTSDKSIKEISDFYSYSNIKPEFIILDDLHGHQAIEEISKFLIKLDSKTELLFNLHSEKTDNSIHLLSTAYILNHYFLYNCKAFYFPSKDDIIEFPVFPNLTIDPIDFDLLNELPKNQTLTKIARKADTSQGTVSLRVKALSESNFVSVEGRDRKLTPSGTLISNLHNELQNIKTQQKITEISKENLTSFVKKCRRSGGFAWNVDIKHLDIKSTLAGVAAYKLLKLTNVNSNSISFHVYNLPDDPKIKIGYRTFNANTLYFYRLVGIFWAIDSIDSLDKKGIIEYLMNLYDHNSEGFKKNNTTKLSDLTTTYEAIASLSMLDYIPDFDMTNFLEERYDDRGGYKQQPKSEKIDITSTYNALAIQKILGYKIPNFRRRAILNYFDTLWTNNGFRRESDKESRLWNNFDIILSIKLLDGNYAKYHDPITKILASFQTQDGGFKTSQNAHNEGLAATYAALAILALFNKLGLKESEIDTAIGLPKQ